MKNITFITGPTKSGKSAVATGLATILPGRTTVLHDNADSELIAMSAQDCDNLIVVAQDTAEINCLPEWFGFHISITKISGGAA